MNVTIQPASKSQVCLPSRGGALSSEKVVRCHCDSQSRITKSDRGTFVVVLLLHFFVSVTKCLKLKLDNCALWTGAWDRIKFYPWLLRPRRCQHYRSHGASSVDWYCPRGNKWRYVWIVVKILFCFRKYSNVCVRVYTYSMCCPHSTENISGWDDWKTENYSLIATGTTVLSLRRYVFLALITKWNCIIVYIHTSPCPRSGCIMNNICFGYCEYLACRRAPNLLHTPPWYVSKMYHLLPPLKTGTEIMHWPGCWHI